jgi:hypothetical protein
MTTPPPAPRARLTLVSDAAGHSVLYEHDPRSGALLSTNRGSRTDLEALAAEHHPGVQIRHIPPQPE